MEISTEQFSKDLAREDELGIILRAHLHIEFQLKEFIFLFLPFSERCDWLKVSYAARVEIALSLGLPEDMRKPLEAIVKMRNDFAHKINTMLDKKTALDFYNGLSDRHREAVKLCYKELGNNEFFQPSETDKLELLQIIVVCIHSAIQAAILEKQKLAKA